MSGLNARDVATRMRAIEDNVSNEAGEDSPPVHMVASKLLGVDPDGLADVLVAEAWRVMDLHKHWYEPLGVELTPINIAGIAFVQGITFAVAAQRMKEQA